MRQGFPPIVGEAPRLLVLGSMPSEASLTERQYYAHPRNAFWPIMTRLFDWDSDLTYAERCAALAQRGVALWDVIASCARQGSADAAIEAESITPNPIGTLMCAHPTLKAVVFNGSTAANAFRQRIVPGLTPAQQRIAQHRLPSTSPAMASLTLEKKIAAWRVILELLGEA